MAAVSLTFVLAALSASAADDFIFVGLKASWDDAEKHCNTALHDPEGGGGHLASIHSEVEARAVKELCGRDDCWIGFNDAAVEGEWRWSDGSAADFTYWMPGEPNGQQQETTDYAYLRDFDNEGRWDDTWANNQNGPESYLRAFVCRGVSVEQAQRGICGERRAEQPMVDYVWGCRVALYAALSTGSGGGGGGSCGSAWGGFYLGLTVAGALALFGWLYPIHRRGGDVKASFFAGVAAAAAAVAAGASALAQKLPESIRPRSGPLARLAPRPGFADSSSAAPLARSDHMPTPSFSPLHVAPISVQRAPAAPASAPHTLPRAAEPPGPESPAFGAAAIVSAHDTVSFENPAPPVAPMDV